MRHEEQIASPLAKNISRLLVERNDCVVLNWSEISLLEDVGRVEGFRIPNAVVTVKNYDILVHVKRNSGDCAEPTRRSRPIWDSAEICRFS